MLLVSLADKAHNASAIVRDVRAGGEAVWARFNAGKSDVVWYYDELCKVYSSDRAPALYLQLHEAVKAMKELAGSTA